MRESKENLNKSKDALSLGWKYNFINMANVSKLIYILKKILKILQAAFLQADPKMYTHPKQTKQK